MDERQEMGPRRGERARMGLVAPLLPARHDSASRLWHHSHTHDEDPAPPLSRFLRRLLGPIPRLRRLLIGVAAVCVLLLGILVWLLFPYLRTFGDIGAGPENAPSRLYGAAPRSPRGRARSTRPISPASSRR